jgi:fumarate hydratase subunit beta
MYSLKTPLGIADILKLRSGDEVLLTGIIYTARDAAHKRLLEDLDKGIEPPFDLDGAIIYYVGPTPAKPGRTIGSAGPTSSYRMDPYSIRLMKLGTKVMIGKGQRSESFKQALIQNQGLYFSAIGGAAALLSQRIRKAEIIAYPELGPEAIHRLEVEDFPVIVTYDAFGGDLFSEGIRKYHKNN